MSVRYFINATKADGILYRQPFFLSQLLLRILYICKCKQISNAIMTKEDRKLIWQIVRPHAIFCSEIAAIAILANIGLRLLSVIQ